MIECDSCGSEDGFGFTCKLCSRTHCKSHRLPEKHGCPNLDKALPPGKTVIGRRDGKRRKEPSNRGEQSARTTQRGGKNWSEAPYLRGRSITRPTPDTPKPLPFTDIPTYGTPPKENLDSGPDTAPDGRLIGQTDTSSLDPGPGRGVSRMPSLVPSRVSQYVEAPALLLFDLLKLAIVVGVAVGVWFLL